MRRTLVASWLLVAACTVPDDFAPSSVDSKGSSSPPPCNFDPTTSHGNALIADWVADPGMPIDAWVGEPVAVEAGWSDESAPGCGFLFDPTRRPRIDVELALAGPATTTASSYTTSLWFNSGYYEILDVTPSAAGKIGVSVTTTNLDSDATYTAAGTLTARVLDDLQITCTALPRPSISASCAPSIAPGTPFTIDVSGIAQGELYLIDPRLTWTGGQPENCALGQCEFTNGASQTVTVAASFAGVTKSLTVTIQ